MKRFVKGFQPAVKAMDWFDWFYLSFIVFASTLFWAVMSELMSEFRP